MPNSIYLLEHIGDDNSWEWWDAYDPDKWTLLEIFNTYLRCTYGEDIHVWCEEDLKREGNCWTHPKYDVRVWKINI